jgi:bacterioferritin-associated ferredoxin
MFVCLCHGVSDKKIRQLVEGGLSSVKQIQATCKAGSDCGQCLAQVKETIRQACQKPQECSEES